MQVSTYSTCFQLTTELNVLHSLTDNVKYTVFVNFANDPDLICKIMKRFYSNVQQLNVYSKQHSSMQVSDRFTCVSIHVCFKRERADTHQPNLGTDENVWHPEPQSYVLVSPQWSGLSSSSSFSQTRLFSHAFASADSSWAECGNTHRNGPIIGEPHCIRQHDELITMLVVSFRNFHCHVGAPETLYAY